MGDNEYDALSGWMPSSLTITESSHTVLELNALATAADDSGSQGAFVDLLTAGGVSEAASVQHSHRHV